jgi:hypothetical protein
LLLKPLKSYTNGLVASISFARACQVEGNRGTAKKRRVISSLSVGSFLPYCIDSNIIDSVLTHGNSKSPMPFEKFENVDAIDNERQKAISKSIRIISVEELKKLGEEIFDEPDRPWRQTFLSLIAENPDATFYHASAGEGVIFLYSRDNDKGLWYLPGSGIGPLSEGGLQLMRKAIETVH